MSFSIIGNRRIYYSKYAVCESTVTVESRCRERLCFFDNETGGLICIGTKRVGNYIYPQLYLIRPRGVYTEEELCKMRGRAVDHFYLAAHYTTRYCMRSGAATRNIILDVYTARRITAETLRRMGVYAYVRGFPSVREARRFVYDRSYEAIARILTSMYDSLVMWVLQCYGDLACMEGTYIGYWATTRRVPLGVVLGHRCRCTQEGAAVSPEEELLKREKPWLSPVLGLNCSPIRTDFKRCA